MEVNLSSKYQVIIPKGIRKKLGLKKGQRFQILVRGGLITLIPDHSIKELRGMLKGMNLQDIREEEDRV
jgi:AbrB family looped-hinge helix DNA binding protein